MKCKYSYAYSTTLRKSHSIVSWKIEMALFTMEWVQLVSKMEANSVKNAPQYPQNPSNIRGHTDQVGPISLNKFADI